MSCCLEAVCPEAQHTSSLKDVPQSHSPLGMGVIKLITKYLQEINLDCVRWVLDTRLELLLRFQRMTLMQHLEEWW